MTVLPNKTTGERIKNLRKKYIYDGKKLSQEKLAELINCNKGTVVDWEADTVLPSTDKLQVLADFFGVSVDYLLCRINETNHDLQFVHDFTGLSVNAILKIKKLDASALNNVLISEHFKKILDLISNSAKYADRRGDIIATYIQSKVNNDKKTAALLEPSVKGGGDTDLIYRANMVVESGLLFDEVSTVLYDLKE